MHRAPALALIAVALSPLCASLARAGDLTPPPGPLAPTDRITLSAQTTPLPYTITQPGSYVLTSNLVGVAGAHAIIIDADNVTLDLNGFALIGVPGSLDAVYANGHHAIRITNGAVHGWGGHGIEITFASESSCVIDHVRADSNAGVGIVANDGAISHCTAAKNGTGGIQLDVGTIAHCAARANSGFGISLYNGSLDSCSATDNQLWGVFLASGSAANCTATYNLSHGFFVGASPTTKGGATVTGCTAANNSADGIRVQGNSTLSGNTCHNNGADGIRLTDPGSRVDSNTVVRNGAIGIHAEDTGNVIIRNTASANATNYAFLAGNASAQIIDVSGVAGFVSSDPFANLIY